MVGVYFDVITSEINESVLFIDEAGKITFINNQAEMMLGWDKKGRADNVLTHFSQIHTHLFAEQECDLCSFLENKGDHYIGKERLVHKDGSSILVSYKIKAITKNETHAGWIFIFEVMNSFKQLESKLTLNKFEIIKKESVDKERKINRLFEALANDEFELYYQPQIDVFSNKIFGAEALVRWNQKETGQIVPPSEFIPLAEETGFIIPLGEQIMRMACKQNKKWQEEGFPPVPISVNVSPIQIRQTNIAETIADILYETGLDPTFLILEITENISLHQHLNLFKKLDKMKEIGVKIAVDDFGTGYSSLSYLHKVPIDYLKIDREFIKDLITDVKCQAIIHSIISMAKNLNILTIAEGVENEQQVQYLSSLGCNLMQGFNFSKPIPNNHYINYMNKWKCKSYAHSES